MSKQIFKYVLIIMGGLSFLWSCKQVVEEGDVVESIFFINPCEGIYEYDVMTDESRLIFSHKEEDLLLEQPIEYENGEVLIGLRDRKKERKGILFYSKFYNTERELIKTIHYQKKANDSLLRVIIYFDGRDRVEETLEDCNPNNIFWNTALDYKCERRPRFYAEDYSRQGKKVYSLHGDICISSDTGDVCIIAFDRQFDPKFGSGYYQPLFLNENEILVRKMPGFLVFKEKPALYKYNIVTKEKTLFVEGAYSDIQLSQNKKYLLYSKHNFLRNFSREKCNDRDIYLMNIQTKKSKLIGSGNYLKWK